MYWNTKPPCDAIFGTTLPKAGYSFIETLNIFLPEGDRFIVYCRRASPSLYCDVSDDWPTGQEQVVSFLVFYQIKSNHLLAHNIQIK